MYVCMCIYMYACIVCMYIYLLEVEASQYFQCWLFIHIFNSTLSVVCSNKFSLVHEIYSAIQEVFKTHFPFCDINVFLIYFSFDSFCHICMHLYSSFAQVNIFRKGFSYEKWGPPLLILFYLSLNLVFVVILMRILFLPKMFHMIFSTKSFC